MLNIGYPVFIVLLASVWCLDIGDQRQRDIVFKESEHHKSFSINS